MVDIAYRVDGNIIHMGNNITYGGKNIESTTQGQQHLHTNTKVLIRCCTVLCNTSDNNLPTKTINLQTLVGGCRDALTYYS